MNNVTINHKVTYEAVEAYNLEQFFEPICGPFKFEKWVVSGVTDTGTECEYVSRSKADAERCAANWAAQ
jgi:hypothetical protein